MASQAERFEDAPDGLTWRIDPLPPSLTARPMDFLVAEHDRQRQAAALLLAIADGAFNRRGVTKLAHFLETDLSLHVADEELSFFPILQQRCLPEDNIGALFDRLLEDHREDEMTGEDVAAVLRSLLDGSSLSAPDSIRLRSFSEHLRRHIALENNVLLPIARVRMGKAAEQELSRRLAQRHRLRGSGAGGSTL